MNEMYLNHGCLINATTDTLGEKLKELQELIFKLREQQWSLAVIRDFWNVPINGGTLVEYMRSNYSKEKQLISILGVMNAGPYFDLEKIYETDNSLEIKPKIENSEFEYPFLLTCFINGQKHITSFNQPIYLQHEQFIVGLSDMKAEVLNSIGLQGVSRTFLQMLSFQSIEEVFNRVEEDNANIIILPDARKSARRHAFKGKYLKVYKLICALYEIELSGDYKRVSEKKEIDFYKVTSCEMSPESPETLKVRRYRQEREFVVPNRGKELFEWHIKIGHDTRIHFFVDEEKKKLYIGHCGAHLGTVSYNS